MTFVSLFVTILSFSVAFVSLFVAIVSLSMTEKSLFVTIVSLFVTEKSFSMSDKGRFGPKKGRISVVFNHSGSASRQRLVEPLKF